MADKRAYFKLDVGYLTNPKVADVAFESSGAVLLHIGSIGYAAQHLTDGEVPVSLLLRLTGATKKDADLLFESGLWERLEDGRALVHDYLVHQRSGAEVKAASEVAKRAAQARWDAEGNADRIAESNASGMPDALQTAMLNPIETPMPRREEIGEEKKHLERDFDEWYARYPKKVSKGSAIKAYKTARKKTDASTLLDTLARHIPVMAAGDPRFIPNPTTWLNGERWLDEPTADLEAAAPAGYFAPFSPGAPPPEVEEDPERYDEWLEGKRAEHYQRNGVQR